MNTISAANREVLKIWERVHIENNLNGLNIKPDIVESWERSKKYGIDPFKRVNMECLNKKELNDILADNKKLLDVVLPTLNTLYNVTREAGFGVVFFNADGYILKRIGNAEDIEYISYTNFVEGTKWTEDVMGTNAVSLTLTLDKPIQIYAYEHYCKHNCLVTCSAAPIHDRKGNIIGVIDLTGPHMYSNAHTLGMAVSSAKAIERELELRRTNTIANKLFKDAKLLDLNKQAILNAMSEGVIAVDRNEIITTINVQSIKTLELSNPDSKYWLGKHISEIFDMQESYLQKTIQYKKSFYAENATIKVAGKKKRFLINCTPYEDKIDDDTNNGAVIILHKPNIIVNRVAGAKAKASFENLIGNNESFINAIDQAKMAARTSSNVLLSGESGVGKDLFAQAIHNDSDRRNEPFFSINCAAIPRELIASELFGYEDGAFTGARKGGNPGKFELADQGTIFLDEIAEMPLDLQAALLRVLEERTIIRLGGREFIPVNVRIIAATNKHLNKQIEKNAFRQDLFFRLNVITITPPPLRKRKGDIPLLVDHFVSSLSNRLGKPVEQVSAELLDCLINYDWPGNIRELNNVIERAINLCKNEALTLDLIPENIREETIIASIPKWKRSMLKEEEEKERQLIEYYLQQESNNRSKVAELLKMSRSSLYRKMRKYNIG